MEFLVLLGRILFGLIFLGSGVGHIMDPGSVTELANAKGVRMNDLMSRLTGVWCLAGGIGVVLGLWTDLALIALIVYLLITAFFIHNFWTDEEPMRTIQMSGFMKNLSMAGGALIYLGVILSDEGYEIARKLAIDISLF